jgi:hypothetical protein
MRDSGDACWSLDGWGADGSAAPRIPSADYPRKYSNASTRDASANNAKTGECHRRAAATAAAGAAPGCKDAAQ